MSENRRFDWDVLLEQDPENPPIRTEPRTEPRVEPTEMPMEFELEPEVEDIDIIEQQTVTIPKNQVPEKPATMRQTEIKRQPEPTAQQQTNSKRPCMNILEGNVTPNQLVNAFILSEVFGKPKGMRRRGRRY